MEDDENKPPATQDPQGQDKKSSLSTTMIFLIVIGVVGVTAIITNSVGGNSEAETQLTELQQQLADLQAEKEAAAEQALSLIHI